MTEKNSERSELQREHQRDIQNLKKEHKREMDVSQGFVNSFFHPTISEIIDRKAVTD